jgi:hypothetical protein
VVFTEAHLLKLAQDLNFTRRSPRKIDVVNLLASLCGECLQGSPSCNDLASHIETISGGAPSRQAVNLRLNEAFNNILQRLLEEVMGEKILRNGSPTAKTTTLFRGYSRVLVQDSTIIKLPGHLFADFSGVANAQSSVCNARIQATYNLIDSRLIGFSIDPYSKNDLAAAPELPLQKGDLVLRDRGYLVMDEIQRHREAGADCIYRHKTGTIYLDPQTLDPIDLPALLRAQGCLDLEVLLNNASRTRARLVTAPVGTETANLRRMKAKKETRGHHPSPEVLELMDWTIFITTIPRGFGRLQGDPGHLRFALAHRNHFQGVEKPYEVPALAPRLQASDGHFAQSQIIDHRRLRQCRVWPAGADVAPKSRPAAQPLEVHAFPLPKSGPLYPCPSILLALPARKSSLAPSPRAILLLRQTKTPKLLRYVGRISLT